MERHLIGESCLCWSIDREISLIASTRIIALYRSIKNLQKEGRLNLLDVVPAYNSIAVYFDPAVVDCKQIQNQVEQLLSTDSEYHLKPGAPDKEIILPVSFTGEDLFRIADHNDLTPAQVISLFTGASYTVAMIGFLPHFPYLIGLSKKLTTPRLKNPRTRVPAGSVAIGGAQAGVYPCESPGGWNILGTTDPALLFSLKPGDKVGFSKL